VEDKRHLAKVKAVELRLVAGGGSTLVGQRGRPTTRAVRTVSGFCGHALVLFGQNFSGSAALAYLGNDGESPDPIG
jgi:hypothetical protein